jgi:hypothetical protein
MAACGYSRLSDDLCVVRPGDHLQPELFGGAPLFKLWPDSARALGLDPTDARPEVSASAKLMFSTPAVGAPWSTKLAAVYILENEGCDRATIEPLAGPQAAATLAGEVYRRAWLAPMGRVEGVLRQVAQLARTPGLCFRLRRPYAFDKLGDVARMVADHHASQAAGKAR